MNNVVELMTYQQWEQLHQQKKRIATEVQRKYRERLRVYYLRQRLFGFMISLVGVGIAVIGKLIDWSNFWGLGYCIILVGLYIAITRQHILYDPIISEKER